jgi:hypothetical protein
VGKDRIKIFYTFAFILLLTLVKCDTTEIPPVENLQLKLEDFSCTEAWLTLTNANHQLPANVIVKQNDQTRRTINLISTDTLLYIDSLLPNQSYSFQAMYSGTEGSPSDKVTFTTIDTTSHKFTWQTWTIGDPGDASQLYDVAIINENDIWAVGRVFLNDTTGQIDPEGYGIVHWNGSNWEARKLYWTHPEGFVYSLLPSGIHAVSEDDIWFVEGNVHHWDGQNLTSYPIGNFPGNPNPIFEEGQYPERIWASSDIAYTVGQQGAIAYFDGNDWEKIDAQTDGDIFDISASENSQTTVFCPLNFEQNTSLNKIFKISQNDMIEFLDYNKGTVYSVWTKRGNPIYACGSGLSDNKRGYWEEINFGEGHLLSRIRGNDLNDIFVVGTYGFTGHYNGEDWKQISEISQPSYQFKSVAVKDDMVVIVGTQNPKGLIIMGRRI